MTTQSFLHTLDPAPIRLGLTQWSHNNWQRKFYASGTKSGQRLARYAQVFNTVEGNTTFYASPAPTTVANWQSATSDEFRFTFKFPKTITHQCQLRHAEDLLADFINLMAPLQTKIGLWKIQLPASFGPDSLPVLDQFLRLLPESFHVGVEVRHDAFFRKGDEERALNRLLIDYNASRIIMDSRPVFAAPPTTDGVIDAQQKKPRVPVHAIATSDRPMVRFIGHPDIAENDTFFTPWISRLQRWIEEGKEPYLMIHTSDNDNAPELAKRLYNQLSGVTALPPLAPIQPESDTPQINLL